MAATKYTHAITDTLNDLLDGPALAQEIRDEAGITIALDSPAVVVTGTNFDTRFLAALSAGEQTTLDNVVAAHTGVPLAKNEVAIVEIQEEKIKTAGGHFQYKSFDLDIPAGAAGDETSVDIVFPYAINIVAAYVIMDAEHKGDYLRSEVSPDTTIGALTADVAATDTVISVQDSVVDNTAVGYKLKLDDGTNVDDLGRVLSISGNDITVETAAVNAFAAATPTYVKQTVMHVPHIRLPGCGRIDIGAANLTSSYLPANTTIRAIYTNNDAVAKKFQIYLEFKY